MATANPQNDIVPETSNAQENPSKLSSRRNDFRERWEKYKATMDSNASSALDLMSNSGAFALKQHLLAEYQMKLEFSFINIYANDTEREIAGRLWNVLMFRPDVVRRTEQLCRDDDVVGLSPFADLLRRAIEAADWPEDFWSLPEAHVEAGHWWRIRDLSDVLAGVATYAILDLKNCHLVLGEEESLIKAHGNFSRDRGQTLANCLAKRSPSDVVEFFKAQNVFVLKAINATIEGSWSLRAARLSGVPERPRHFTERTKLFSGALDTVMEAVTSSEQRWISLFGPGGAGKTTLAMELARAVSEKKVVSDVVWLSFRDRDSRHIFEDAQPLLADILSEKKRNSSEEFLKEHLTMNATAGLILFIDDVWSPNHLKPFKECKCVVFSSRKKMDKVFRQVTLVQVPLSLTKGESEEVFSKVFGSKALLSNAAVVRMLCKVAYNALATTALAALLKDAKEEEFAEIEEHLNSEFDDIDAELDESAEFFPSQSERNIAKVLKMTISRLEGDRKEDFDRLFIFPTGLAITPKIFAAFYNNSERRANNRLVFLEARCILEKRREEFVIHDLWLDVLKEMVTKEQRKQHLGDFCDGCLKPWPNIDWEDKFLLEWLPAMCFDGDKVDHASQLLSSVRFLYEKSKRTFRGKNCCVRDLLILRAFEIEADRLDPLLSRVMDFRNWKVPRDSDWLRLLALFDCRSLDSDILQVAKAEAALPLFRFDRQTEVERKVTITRDFNLKGVSDGFLVQLPFGRSSQISDAEIISSIPFHHVLIRPIKLQFPLPELSSNCGVAWIPCLEDFATFFCDPETKELRIELSSGNVLLRHAILSCDLSGFFDVRACGNKVAFWEDRGRRFLLFTLKSESADVIEVKALEDADERKVWDVFPMTAAVAVQFSDGSLEIWNHNSFEKVAENVLSVAVSQCGTKLGLFIWKGGVLEVEGKETRTRMEAAEFKDKGKLCYLPNDGMLVWNSFGQALLIPSEGANKLHLKNFPWNVSRAALLDSGHVFLVSRNECWLYDTAREVCETVLTKELTTDARYLNFYDVACDSRRVWLGYTNNFGGIERPFVSLRPLGTA